MYGNTIWDDIKWQYKFGSDVIKLILVNVGVFVVVQMLFLFSFLTQNSNFGDSIFSAFSLHANLHVLLYKPWQLFTYMFLHEKFWHILWNMVALYWFGNIVGDLIGKSKVIPIYILGGLVGGFFYLTAYNLLPVFANDVNIATAIGASAGVTAIVMAATTISPNYEIRLFMVLNVKLKWLTAAYIFVDLISIQYDNPGGHIAHLGGFFIGWLYIVLLRSGTDMAKPFHAIQDFITNLFAKKSNLKVAYKNENKQASSQTRKQTTAKQNNINVNKQEYLDTILDKINKSSYESLSQEEKDFLFKVSQED